MISAAVLCGAAKDRRRPPMALRAAACLAARSGRISFWHGGNPKSPGFAARGHRNFRWLGAEIFSIPAAGGPFSAPRALRRPESGVLRRKPRESRGGQPRAMRCPEPDLDSILRLLDAAAWAAPGVRAPGLARRRAMDPVDARRMAAACGLAWLAGARVKEMARLTIADWRPGGWRACGSSPRAAAPARSWRAAPGSTTWRARSGASSAGRHLVERVGLVHCIVEPARFRNLLR